MVEHVTHRMCVIADWAGQETAVNQVKSTPCSFLYICILVVINCVTEHTLFSFQPCVQLHIAFMVEHVTHRMCAIAEWAGQETAVNQVISTSLIFCMFSGSNHSSLVAIRKEFWYGPILRCTHEAFISQDISLLCAYVKCHGRI